MLIIGLASLSALIYLYLYYYKDITCFSLSELERFQAFLKFIGYQHITKHEKCDKECNIDESSPILKHILREENVSEDSVSEDSVSEDSVSEDNVSEDDVSEDNVSEDDVSEDKSEVVTPDSSNSEDSFSFS